MTDSQPVIVAKHFLDLVGSGASGEEIAMLFAEEADFYVRGDETHAPWLGRRRGRTEIAQFVADLREHTEPVEYEVQAVIGDEQMAVVLGCFRTLVRRTGKTFEGEFAYVFKLRGGMIVHYRVLEDSLGVSRAAQ